MLPSINDYIIERFKYNCILTIFMADDDKKESGIDAGRVALGGLAGLVLGMIAPPLGIAAKLIGSAAYTVVSGLVNKSNDLGTSVGEAAASYGGMALGQYLNPLYYIL